MVSIALPKVFLLFFMAFMVTSASAIEQYGLKQDNAVSKQPYICAEPPSPNITAPRCCWDHPPCHDRTCPKKAQLAFNASTATRLSGTIDIIVEGYKHKTVQAVADLTTRRNFIASTVVNDLGLCGMVRKLADIDVHDIAIGRCNVTVTEFVFLSIATGVDKFLRHNIFEVVTPVKSEDEEFVLPDLVVGLNSLSDAGALAINPAIFTSY
jgi:hypothetical protein